MEKNPPGRIGLWPSASGPCQTTGSPQTCPGANPSPPPPLRLRAPRRRPHAAPVPAPPVPHGCAPPP
jgi:hypothetical protein